MKFNVVVVGGGLAGLSAALRSAELGLHVALLEQGDNERYPCNTRYSGGILHVSYHDVKRDPTELLRIVRQVTSDEVSLPLAEAISTDAGRLLDWLQQHGARFMRFSPLEAHKWCMSPPRAMAPGLDWQGRGPDVTMRLLTDKLKSLGGQIFLGARARALVMEDDACVGVGADINGADRELRADAVVICDGGFQANRELFEKNIGHNFEEVLQRGAANGRGDGLRMAQQAGAALTRRDRFYGHLLSRDSFSNEKVWPYPELDGVAACSVVVGPDGRRIVDEGAGGISMANALAKLDHPAAAIAVFDEAIWNGPGKSARIPANPFLEKAGGTVHRENSIEALAARIEVPADALAATIAAHNNAIENGGFETLTPPRSQGAIKPMPIRAAPFMAIPLCAGITYTMGGIAIDGNSRVLRDDGSTIRGLFAAGASTGGLEGGGKLGYVSGLVKAGVFGMRAAEQIHRERGA